MAASRRPAPGRRGAARSTARPQPRAPVPRVAAPARRPSAAGLTTRAAVLGLVVCAVLVSAALPLREYLAQRGAIRAAVATQQAQQRRVQALEAEAQRLRDPAYVALQARRRLHYVKPGETAYILLPPPGTPRPDGGGPAPVTSPVGPDAPWYEQLYGSVRAADGSAPAG